MSMQYVRDRYKVPAKRGRRVDVYRQLPDGSWVLSTSGVITSASCYIRVRTPGARRPISLHPTWGIVYLDDDGSILLDTRGKG